MPDHDKNTGEWPEAQGRRISQVQDGYGFFVDDGSEIDAKTARAFDDSPKWETERYLPIHSIRGRLREATRTELEEAGFGCPEADAISDGVLSAAFPPECGR